MKMVILQQDVADTVLGIIEKMYSITKIGR